MIKPNKKLILLDVHAILHRAYHALPGFTSSKGEPTGGLYGVSAFLIKIIGELKPDYIVACYDLPAPTFRKKLYEEYKAGRKKPDEALVAQMIRSRDIFRAFDIPIYEKAGFEADDMLGTIAEQAKKDSDIEVIIASGDLDTLQLVLGNRVVVYTLKKGLNDTVIYDERAVVARFGFRPKFLADYKGLRGDPSDNIIGIKGIGEKTAEELIKNFGSLEEIYRKLETEPEKFSNLGIKDRIIELLKNGKEEALFSKMLATIKLDVPIDFKLPAKTFKESLDTEKVKKIFHELEFRTLGPRLETMLEVEPPRGSTSEAPDNVNQELSKKLSIATWLLNSDLTNPTMEDIYTAAKTRDVGKLLSNILSELEKNKLEKVYSDIELPLIPIIKKIEERGICLDVSGLKELSIKYHERLALLERKIWDLAGQEFNVNSPKQLGEIIFDKLKLTAKGLKKTAGGARSTRESELLKLKGTNPIIEELLSYREIQKLLSTYIDALPLLVDGSGRLHTHLNQTGTTTGRMSSTEPNLQNIPASGEIAREIRKTFVAPPGFLLVAFDYSQIEMRVLAWLSNDKNLKDIFIKGEDVHSAVASRVFGVSEKDVTKEMRRKAKVINFGIVYGMGLSALQKNLGGTREEAEEFYQNFFKQFPSIESYFEEVKNEARKKGFVTTAFGRRRYFPMINSKLPYIRAEAERMAVNAALQGTAADIIKLAMIKADKEIETSRRSDKTFLVLQIHDELLYEVKDDNDFSESVSVIKRAMEEAADCPLPLVVNVSSGKNWGELK